MGVAGDPFRCRNWEPKTPQQEERLERWLKETRQALLFLVMAGFTRMFPRVVSDRDLEDMRMVSLHVSDHDHRNTHTDTDNNNAAAVILPLG